MDLLDIDQYSPLIIERILAYGNRDEVRWLLKIYGRDLVNEWVMRSGMSRFPWRRYHLWCFVFNLPKNKKPVRIWQY